jgi:hypothetical protein
MAPGHCAPGITAWIVLVIEMVNAIFIHQPVGIIHPIALRAIVELRPIELRTGLACAPFGKGEGQSPENEGLQQISEHNSMQLVDSSERFGTVMKIGDFFLSGAIGIYSWKPSSLLSKDTNQTHQRSFGPLPSPSKQTNSKTALQ